MSADPNPEAVEILEKVGDLYLNEDYSDVVFVVKDQNVPAHQAILGQRSPVFKAMFPPKSDLRKQVVAILETSAEPFQLFLKFIYTGTANVEKDLCTVNLCTVFDVMTLAKTYEFPRLVEFCADRIKHVCATVNAVELINEAVEDSHEELVDAILDNVSVLNVDVFTHECFNKLPVKAMHRILEKSTSVPDDRVFRAFVDWMKANPSESEHFPDLFELMDLKSMEIDEIVDPIRPLFLVSDSFLLDFVSKHAKAKRAKGDALKSDSDVNVITDGHPTCSETPTVATIVHNTKNTKTSDGNNLICSSATRVFNETSTTFVNPSKAVVMKHAIANGNESITIDLERSFMKNKLEMKLADGDWSYWIEVSEDKIHRTRIIDYSTYICRSVQRLYFHSHIFRYVHIHGIAPVGGIFEISHFGAYYDKQPLKVDLETGCAIPTYNVASAKNNAIVIQGQNWANQHAMLNGYTPDNDFTFHHVGRDPIIVQLPQPYSIDSLKFKLDADCSHDYNIEVSADKINWTQVVDAKQANAWQYAVFYKRPVVFIKLTATHVKNSYAFCCRYFECPVIYNF